MSKEIPVVSNDADKFVVRLPEGMRPRLAEKGKELHCSMNSVAILALEMYLDKTGRQDALLDALTAQLAAVTAQLEALKAVQP